jgi:hypothetical protein
VPFALCDSNGVVCDSIDESIGAIDTPTPISCVISFQRLGLANAIVTIAVNVLEKLVDTLTDFFVLLLPV